MRRDGFRRRGPRSTREYSWEFLGLSGDVLAASLAVTSNSEGAAIAASFNPIDLTDSSFSFSGVRYSFTILNDPRLSGLPAVFNEGVVTVQAQGEITFLAIPEPPTVTLTVVGLLFLLSMSRLGPLRRASQFSPPKRKVKGSNLFREQPLTNVKIAGATF